MREMIVLSATGAVGVTPMVELSFYEGLKRNPHVLGADAGSNDLGPYGLGADDQYNPREWVKHDLEMLVVASVERRIPAIVGSAGHMGTNKGVDSTVEIVKEIAAERKLPPFKLGMIYSELDKDYLEERAAKGEVEGLEGSATLTVEDVRASFHVVAMMGVEPIIKALDMGAQVIIAGRACDDAIFAAPPIREGYPKGLAFHLGKVVECASLAGTPYMARSTILGTIRDDCVLFEPMHPKQRCTIASIAGHSLYERVEPYLQAGPGGVLDLHDVVYEQYDYRTTKVSGAKWIEQSPYKVKLEGAGWVGFRRLAIVGIRDPDAVKNVDAILDFVHEGILSTYNDRREKEDYHIFFHVYGKNAIMRELEPVKEITSHELGIVMEVVSKSEELATNITCLAKRYVNQALYPGHRATGGGGAYLGDEVLKGHDAYRWTIHHLLPLSDPCEIFPIKVMEIGGGS